METAGPENWSRAEIRKERRGRNMERVVRSLAEKIHEEEEKKLEFDPLFTFFKERGVKLKHGDIYYRMPDLRDLLAGEEAPALSRIFNNYSDYKNYLEELASLPPEKLEKVKEYQAKSVFMRPEIRETLGKTSPEVREAYQELEEKVRTGLVEDEYEPEEAQDELAA